MSEHRQGGREPTVEPGQIWLIEQTATSDLSPLDRDALTHANVVLYDRALESLVAHALPLGSYAEPLAANGHDDNAGPAISPRALRFAADGWSVVQLVASHGGGRRPRARWHAVAAALSPLNGAVADVPVRVIVKAAADDCCRSRDACLPALSALIDDSGDDDLLTLVFGPLAVGAPARVDAFTANGLAG
jgi:hypothetical protein